MTIFPINKSCTFSKWLLVFYTRKCKTLLYIKFNVFTSFAPLCWTFQSTNHTFAFIIVSIQAKTQVFGWTDPIPSSFTTHKNSQDKDFFACFTSILSELVCDSQLDWTDGDGQCGISVKRLRKHAETSRNLQPFLTLLRSKFGTDSKVEVFFWLLLRGHIFKQQACQTWV